MVVYEPLMKDNIAPKTDKENKLEEALRKFGEELEIAKGKRTFEIGKKVKLFLNDQNMYTGTVLGEDEGFLYLKDVSIHNWIQRYRYVKIWKANIASQLK